MIGSVCDLHQKFLFTTFLDKSYCPLCDLKISNRIENKELEKLASILARLAKSVLEHGPFDAPRERIFHEAIKENQFEVTAFLLNQSLSVSALVEGISPLYRACEQGSVEIAQLLLENNARVDQKNDLSQKSNYSVNDYQHLHGAIPLEAAILKESKELVTVLIKYNASIDTIEPGRLPIFVAICNDKEDLALFLIEKGANIQIKDGFGIPLISMAIRCGQLKVVQELVRRRVDLDTKKDSCPSVLHEAAKKNDHILHFLLENGAKEHVNDLWLGLTPLFVAARYCKVENVKRLLEAKADLSTKYQGENLVSVLRADLVSAGWKLKEKKQIIEILSKSEWNIQHFFPAVSL